MNHDLSWGPSCVAFETINSYPCRRVGLGFSLTASATPFHLLLRKNARNSWHYCAMGRCVTIDWVPPTFWAIWQQRGATGWLYRDCSALKAHAVFWNTQAKSMQQYRRVQQ